MNGIMYSPPISNASNLLNVTADLSWLQGKNHHCTTEDGHSLAYIADITVLIPNDGLEGTNEIYLQTIPNTWRMRNAVRKFHFARREMFKLAGVSVKEMGRYGRTMRPLFDTDHALAYSGTGATDNRTLPVGYYIYDPTSSVEGAEWTYTSLANMVPQREGETTPTAPLNIMPALVDEWYLKVLDESDFGTPGATNVSYENVGMIHAYNQDRMNVTTPDSDLAQTIQNNPLASLTAQIGSTGAIVDIAEDQESEHPPYDQRHEGNSIRAEFSGIFQSSASVQTAVFRNVVMPLGYVKVFSTKPASRIFVEVTGMVECRELE